MNIMGINYYQTYIIVCLVGIIIYLASTTYDLNKKLTLSTLPPPQAASEIHGVDGKWGIIKTEDSIYIRGIDGVIAVYTLDRIKIQEELGL